MTSQKGSAHVIIIVGLVALLIGALGYIYWQNVNNNTPVVSNGENTQTDDLTSDQDIIVDAPAQSADVRLKELYSKYLASSSSHKGDSGVNTHKQSGYIAASYTSENNAGEPLICGQEAYPDSMMVEQVGVVEGIANLNATKVYSDGSAASNSLKLTMSLNDSNEWQLLKTECITN